MGVPTIVLEREFFLKHFGAPGPSGVYVAEASDLGLKCALSLDIRIRNFPTPGADTLAHYVGTDKNGDEVAGWNYESIDKSIRLLIIND